MLDFLHACLFVGIRVAPREKGKKKIAIIISPTAAAVLAVGTLVQSPRPKMFGYLLCCSVSFLTSKKPAASVIGEVEFFNVSGADIGGATWRKSY